MNMPEHAKPAQRDRLLPALVLIVACGLLEVWASWLTIASVSGFPKLGRMTTGWILPVTTEAYWTVALYAWIVDPVGPRSRRFAMVTAIIIFALSLTGQEGGHLVAATGRPAPALVVGLVTALPLIAVGLGAVLIHLRHLDREDAEAAERARVAAVRQAAVERTEADERTALRAELDRAKADREAVLAEARTALETVRGELAETVARADEEAARSAELAAKLDRIKKRSPAGPGPHRTAPKTGTGTARSTAPDDDLALEAKALELLATDLTMTGAELARKLGVTEGYGRKLRRRLTQQDRPAEPVLDRPQDRDGTGREDRSEDRS